MRAMRPTDSDGPEQHKQRWGVRLLVLGLLLGVRAGFAHSDENENPPERLVPGIGYVELKADHSESTAWGAVAGVVFLSGVVLVAVSRPDEDPPVTPDP